MANGGENEVEANFLPRKVASLRAKVVVMILRDLRASRMLARIMVKIHMQRKGTAERAAFCKVRRRVQREERIL